MPGIDLTQICLFNDLNQEQLARLEPLFTARQIPAGDTLFLQGDLADSLYILASGEVSLRYKPDDGPEINIARVRPEGVIGWSAILGSQSYSSSAICLSDCAMMSIRGEDLRRLCDREPTIGSLVLERLAKVIPERLQTIKNPMIALLSEGLCPPSHNSSST